MRAQTTAPQPDSSSRRTGARRREPVIPGRRVDRRSWFRACRRGHSPADRGFAGDAARIAAAPGGVTASRSGGHRNPDRAGDRRCSHHAHRRRQPGARLRHRRRGKPHSLSREDRGSEGRRGDAVHARGRARVGRGAVRHRGGFDALHRGDPLDHRGIRAPRPHVPARRQTRPQDFGAPRRGGAAAQEGRYALRAAGHCGRGVVLSRERRRVVEDRASLRRAERTCAGRQGTNRVAGREEGPSPRRQGGRNEPDHSAGGRPGAGRHGPFTGPGGQ